MPGCLSALVSAIIIINASGWAGQEGDESEDLFFRERGRRWQDDMVEVCFGGGESILGCWEYAPQEGGIPQGSLTWTSVPAELPTSPSYVDSNHFKLMHSRLEFLRLLPSRRVSWIQFWYKPDKPSAGEFSEFLNRINNLQVLRQAFLGIRWQIVSPSSWVHRSS